ncbi:MAG: hypothetical protein GF330_05450 [Candidatus Eisenbacteria bacterium]|nr:hypothetical protein [Candidatus Eisenbacteria bacterium]
MPRRDRPGLRRRARGRARRIVRSVWESFARFHPAPLIVLGNQKSGTTAIAALLGELTGQTVTLDLQKEIRRPRLPDVQAGRMTWEAYLRANRHEFSRPIVKEPHLTPFYRPLAAQLPGARFLLIVRDPRENLRSILNRLHLPGDLARLTPRQWDTISPAWRMVVDGRWLGIEGGSYIEMLARRWQLCAEVGLRNREAMRVLRYEEFVARKLETLRELAWAYGWRERHDIRSRLDVQFQPAGRRGVDWRDFFGDGNLSRIEEICAGGMRAFGYEIAREGGRPQ